MDQGDINMIYSQASKEIASFELLALEGTTSTIFFEPNLEILNRISAKAAIRQFCLV